LSCLGTDRAVALELSFSYISPRIVLSQVPILNYVLWVYDKRNRHSKGQYETLSSKGAERIC